MVTAVGLMNLGERPRHDCFASIALSCEAVKRFDRIFSGLYTALLLPTGVA